jgi:CubicO group peptidase (beta-lactamase class C family)
MERLMTGRADVDGYAAPGFEGVADAFARNFEEGYDIGAAFAVYRDGEALVDLWGGYADRAAGRAWRRETLQLIFSGTKGLTATCILMLIDRGLLSLDDPVCKHWPEFDKPDVLVRHIVSHQARLPGITAPVSADEIADDVHMARMLARQARFDDPRAAFLYHPLTFGWLCGELVRRVDGRSIGEFFAQEVAAPLALDFWIGLPAGQEQNVSTLELADNWGAHTRFFDPPAPGAEDDALLRAIWRNPPILAKDAFPWNSRRYHAGQIPAANGIGAARSIARLYSLLAAGGAPLMRAETLRLGVTQLCAGYDPMLQTQRRHGVGFQLQTDQRLLGAPEDAFGHTGAGGSAHGAWPGQRIGFSYAMNLLRDEPERDPRAKRLLDALAEALRAG